ncbi:MAG: UvrD-helicase domain-containing protein, partial [Nitrospinae bacterium]|nr:UvrD-helicase domain-containing protein [Nitrospinota bacterium]
KTHKENETICLETFHYQIQEGNLLDSLASQLKSHGIPIEPIPDESRLETLREFGEISKLSNLLSLLLCNVKNSCQTIEEAIEIAQNANSSSQAMAALGLLLPILENYENTLKVNGEIDFNDMIHHATRYVNEGKFVPKWKYILIDEFQDISSSRANLVKALRDAAEDCILFCVGDDWQSIYRFTGSDLNYTTEFGTQFGNCSLIKLDKTYRFNNSICDVATKFVTQNPIQEKKHLITNDHVDSPAVSIMRVEDSCNIVHVEKALDRISALADKPSKVYVISRYNFLVDTDQLKALLRSYPKLSISQISMHGSKGKEADYVIIFGLEKGENGFPSEKTTHPLLELYLPPEESFPNAEERRLFYVAITRAKKRVYLIADMAKASSFMTELLKKGQYELCLDEFETPIEQIEYEVISCPSCSTGTLSLRVNSKTKQKFVGCSNFKRCTHIESCCPKCDGIMSRKGRFKTCISCGWKIPMCLKCNGEMKKRSSTGHWGCSNYRGKENIPTCTFQEKSIAF